ncbi:MAG: hypothetical protein JW774_04300 [Candidatus Aureabacteria bacterium]|nr:hypothetical protein [Candidatus Auribacterota bacterium]
MKWVYIFLAGLFLSGCVNWNQALKRSLFANSQEAKTGKTYEQFTDDEEKARQDYDMINRD